MINSQNTYRDLPSGGNDDCENVQTSNFPAGRRQSERGDMNSLLIAPAISQTGLPPRSMIRDRIARAQPLGAVVGLGGGIFAALFGSLLTIVSWFVANEAARVWLPTIGTALLCLTTPLLIFGGYCLDWMEKDKPQRHSKVVRYEDDDEEEW